MDIESLSMTMNAVNLTQSVGVAVAGLVKDGMAQEGAALEKLLESAPNPANLEALVTPHLGAVIDIKL